MLSALPLVFAVVATEPGLRWHAPGGCPTRDDAADYLDRELEVDPKIESSEVWVEQTDDGWRAEVTIDDGPPRTLTATSCEGLMVATMVVIAVARDAQPETFVPEPAAIPDPAPPTEPAPIPQSSPIRQPGSETQPAPIPQPEPGHGLAPTAPQSTSMAPSPRLAHWLGIHAGVAAVHVPALTARIGLRYEFGKEAWALRVDGRYESPRELRYSDAGVGGRFQTVGAELSGCWTPGRGAWSGAMCGGASAGMLFGLGVGLPDPERPRAAQVGVFGSTGLRWKWNEAWRLTLDGLFSTGIIRPEFHVGDRAPLFQSPRLGAAGTIGFERRLR